ncbi:MAG: hypothetical protein DCC49_08565 [Acidobacteria bacterium]|nr:MAG: hypothetical protein DCC49_08565 [Acidobacteriota bacterium]
MTNSTKTQTARPEALANPASSHMASGRSSASIDGRVRRGERSREAIVGAMLDLIREGVTRPSSNQIADRAGVTQRTLFNHFADVPTLMGEVVAAQVEFVRRNLPEPPESSLPILARAEQFFGEIAGLLDAIAPVRIAAYSFPVRMDAVDAGVENVRSLLREAIAQTFAPELARLSHAEFGEVLDELEVLADPVSWRLRRVLQQHSSQAAAMHAAHSACKIAKLRS